MKCQLHSWKLNPATMTYASKGPVILGKTIDKGGETVKQPEFTVVKNADGSYTLTPPAGSGGGGCSLC